MASVAWLGGEVGTATDLSFRQAYSSVTTVFACINRIADDASSVPLHIYRRQRDRTLVRLEPTENEAARIFDTVNPLEGATSFFRTHWIWMELWGESVWLLDYLGRATPQEMYVLDPALVSVQTSRAGIPVGYNYRTPSGEIAYETREVYHGKYFNPENPLRGLAPLAAASLPANLEYLTQRHWKNVMKRGGFVSGVLTSEGYIEEEHRKQVQKEWRDLYGGTQASQSGGIAFLQGNTKFQPIGLTPKDADFINQAKLTREQVCEAFRVPKTLIGVVEDANYSNAKEMTFSYFVQTVFPKLRLLEEDLNQIVLPRFGDDLVARFDMDAVPIVQEMNLERAQKFSSLTGAPILTRNEARIKLGLPPLSGGDILLEPTAYAPGGVSRPESPNAPLPMLRGVKAVPKFIDTPERSVKRLEAARGMESYDGEVLGLWTDHLNRQEKRLLARMESAMAGKGVKAPEDPEMLFEDVYDVETELEATTQLVKRIYLRILRDQGQAAIEQLPASAVTDFLVNDPAVLDWLETKAPLEAKLVNNRTFQMLRDTIVQGMRDGMTPRQMATEVQGQFDLRRAEITRAVRTEVSRAYNFATQSAWKQSGLVTDKQWLTAGDEHVRNAQEAGGPVGHDDLDGNSVAMDAAFANGLEYPGDPNGPPGQVVNCRCSLLPILSEQRSYRVSDSLLRSLVGANGRKEAS